MLGVTQDHQQLVATCDTSTSTTLIVQHYQRKHPPLFIQGEGTSNIRLSPLYICSGGQPETGSGASPSKIEAVDAVGGGLLRAKNAGGKEEEHDYDGRRRE